MACYTYKNNKYKSREELESLLVEEQIQFQKSGITPITNGFIYKNDVYLNKNADDSVLLHEFNHLYNNWLKQNRPEVYKKGLDLVKAELEKTANVSVKDRVRKKEVDVDGLNGHFEEILSKACTLFNVGI